MSKQPMRVLEGKALPFAPFWTVRDATQTGGDPEIIFDGVISEYSWFGDEVTPKKFRDDLSNVGKGGPVTVRIHSPGGEVFAASAIRAMLSEYPGEVTVCIDGLCASAAVAVALAGDTVKIYDTAYMMIHNPSMVVMGDADLFEKYAAELRLFKEGLLDAYEQRTGATREVISSMMDAETWMTAKQAVELGFADEVISGGKPAKVKNVLNFINMPTVLNAADEEPEPAQGEDGQVPADPEPVLETTAQARSDPNLGRLEKARNFLKEFPHE